MLHMKPLPAEHNGSQAGNDAHARPPLQLGVQCSERAAPCDGHPAPDDHPCYPGAGRQWSTRAKAARTMAWGRGTGAPHTHDPGAYSDAVRLLGMPGSSATSLLHLLVEGVKGDAWRHPFVC